MQLLRIVWYKKGCLTQKIMEKSPLDKILYGMAPLLVLSEQNTDAAQTLFVLYIVLQTFLQKQTKRRSVLRRPTINARIE